MNAQHDAQGRFAASASAAVYKATGMVGKSAKKHEEAATLYQIAGIESAKAETAFAKAGRPGEAASWRGQSKAHGMDAQFHLKAVRQIESQKRGLPPETELSQLGRLAMGGRTKQREVNPRSLAARHPVMLDTSAAHAKDASKRAFKANTVEAHLSAAVAHDAVAATQKAGQLFSEREKNLAHHSEGEAIVHRNYASHLKAKVEGKSHYQHSILGKLRI